MLDSKALPALNAAVNKLMGLLASKQEELRRREQSQGKSHDVQKMNRLRYDIRGLESRLRRAEQLQEQALAAGR